VLDCLRNRPDSRRILFHAWNVEYLPDESLSPQENARAGRMALPPCHLLYQFYVARGRLSAQLYIRSSDSFLGLPFNMASLATLVLMLAQQTDLEPGEIVITTGDSHLYLNHLEQVREQLSREPRPLPELALLRRPQMFTITASRTSSCAATIRTRIFPRRWPCECAAPRAGRCGGRQRCDRSQQCPALGFARGSPALQAPHHGQADHHGAPPLSPSAARCPGAATSSSAQPGPIPPTACTVSAAWMPAMELAEHIALIDGSDELMVIGGAQIYALALPRAPAACT
jgi:hypothetical protein